MGGHKLIERAVLIKKPSGLVFYPLSSVGGVHSVSVVELSSFYFMVSVSKTRLLSCESSAS